MARSRPAQRLGKFVKARFMFGPMDGEEKDVTKPLPMLVRFKNPKSKQLESEYELVFHDEASAIYRWKP